MECSTLDGIVATLASARTPGDIQEHPLRLWDNQVPLFQVKHLPLCARDIFSSANNADTLIYEGAFYPLLPIAFVNSKIEIL